MLRVRIFLMLMLAWWFAITSGSSQVGRVVGPFGTEDDCNSVRTVFQERWVRTTHCWRDGK